MILLGNPSGALCFPGSFTRRSCHDTDVRSFTSVSWHQKDGDAGFLAFCLVPLLCPASRSLVTISG